MTEMNGHKQAVAGYFSRNARYWDEIYREGEDRSNDFSLYAKNKRKDLVETSLDAFANGRTLRVLDVGCGPGVFMEAALRRGHSVAGVDIAEEMVSTARARLASAGYDQFSCQTGDLEQLPFESEEADVVMCLGVLPYVRNDSRALAEMLRVLKPGGMGIVILSNLLKLGNLLDPYYYLVRAWQFLWYRVAGKYDAADLMPDPQQFGDNREFGIRRHTLYQSVAMLKEQGTLPADAVSGIEYGPLTLWRKPVLSEKRSIALSELISKWSKTFACLQWFANEWVICFQKEARGDQR